MFSFNIYGTQVYTQIFLFPLSNNIFITQYNNVMLENMFSTNKKWVKMTICYFILMQYFKNTHVY